MFAATRYLGTNNGRASSSSSVYGMLFFFFFHFNFVSFIIIYKYYGVARERTMNKLRIVVEEEEAKRKTKLK